MLDGVVSGVVSRPRKTCIYGLGGVGKSYWAAKHPAAIFLPTEEGANDLPVDKFPVSESYEQFKDRLAQLITDQHDYKTLVVDSLDWLEPLIWSAVESESGKPVAEHDYGKGYGLALAKWQHLLAGFDCLRQEKNMSVVLIAHASIRKFTDPAAGSYDRFEPKLHHRAAALVVEWVDELLFAAYEVFTSDSRGRFGAVETRGVGDGRRVMRTCERPAWLAKNRLGMPAELPLDYEAYSNFLAPKAPQPDLEN